MIDLSTFNLVYLRKSDGQMFLVKLVTKVNYRIINSSDGKIDDISEAKLKRWYSPVRELNRVNKKRPPFMNYGRKRIA